MLEVMFLRAGIFFALLLPGGLLQGQGQEALLEQRLMAAPGSQKAWTLLVSSLRRGEALAVAERVVTRYPGSRLGWMTLARLATAALDYPLSVRAFEQVASLAVKRQDWRGEARALAKLFGLHQRLGANVAANQVLLRYREARRRSGQSTDTADRMLRITEHERDLGQLPLKARYRRLAREARGRGDANSERDALVYLEYLLAESSAVKELAEGYQAGRRVLALHKKLSLPPSQVANDKNGCARLALELALRKQKGEPRQKLLRSALDLGEEAFKGHRTARQIAERELLRDHCLLAQVNEALGRIPAARIHYTEELRLVRKNRRDVAAGRARGDPAERALRSFDGEVHHIFEDDGLFHARGLLGESPDLKEALRVTEWGRVGALRELYLLRGRKSPAWMERDITVSQLVRQAARAKAAILVYLVGSHQAGVVSITAEGLFFTELGNRDALDRVARRFAEVVLDLSSSRKAVAEAGRVAFKAFLGKIWGRCARGRRLVFVGLSRHAYMPLAAMVTPGSAPLDQRYLGAVRELVRVPTLGSLTGPETAPAAGPPLALGYSGRGPYAPELARYYQALHLSPLERAEEEATQVARLLQGQRLTGSKATEAALEARAPLASIIHLAGHALVDFKNGSRTALLLAPGSGPGEDGFLTLSEILELKLRSRLVVLSACSSARGEEIQGEGVRGLARCFLVAGAHHVLASLAPVDDQTAPLFLAPLCRALLRGASVGGAARTARLAMLRTRTTSHPALWSCFTLFGQEVELAGSLKRPQEGR